MKILKPSPLKKGDLIGLISPASKITDTGRIDRAVQYLESLGYRAMVGANATRLHGYLAGTDEERAADVHAMFEHREVKAIFCIRGGYGTPRLLPLLHYRIIARNPKIFVGYSDITAIHLALWKHAGLVSFHGPMAGVDMADPMDPFTEEVFWRLLTSTKKGGAIVFPQPPPEGLVPGKASGRLLGGNLALVAALIGTRYQPRFDDAILYLEDIGEDPYRVDRMFTQLRGASILARCSGIMIGHFTDCVPKDPSLPTFTTDEVIREYLTAAQRPALWRVPFGHERRNMPIPVGVRARIDAGTGAIEFLESAVR
jgi:muramoyltetrapeptide carboxypeptidase